MAIDEQELQAFVGQMVQDLSAGEAAVLSYVGDRLGLYKVLAEGGAMTSHDLADRSGTSERYVREWLRAQVAGGYVDYDQEDASYTLPPERAYVLADETSPLFVGGVFEVTAAMWAAADRIVEAFQTGEGVGWHEHDERLFRGVERFFGPLYDAHLTNDWIPALDGVEDKLRGGARVADVGCGHGVSTIVMARDYPRSTFVGFDYHEASVEAARKNAAEAGVGDRVDFQVASAKDFPGKGYDLVCFFDCLHDMGDPVGAAAHARRALAPKGTVFLVEPFAHDELRNGVDPVARLYASGSTVLCTPSSLSQEVGLGLGAQAGEARLRQLFEQAGFAGFRRAAETPFNLILEATP